MQTKKKNSGKTLQAKKAEDLNKVNSLMDSLGLADYMDYLSSPWRVAWMNLLAGVMRGLGFILGMTVVVALMTFIISYMVALPVIGEWFMWLKDVIGG